MFNVHSYSFQKMIRHLMDDFCLYSILNGVILRRDVVENNKWRPLSLSELTPMVVNTGLTHLGLEASK